MPHPLINIGRCFPHRLSFLHCTRCPDSYLFARFAACLVLNASSHLLVFPQPNRHQHLAAQAVAVAVAVAVVAAAVGTRLRWRRWLRSGTS